jgi:hypothetical protein
MVNGIRVTLICAVISASAGQVQFVALPWSFRPPIENEYVKVTVAPPLTTDAQGVLALGINTWNIPLVQLRVPTKFINPDTGLLEPAELGKVSAFYVAPGGHFSGSRSYESHEAFIYIDLKSSPSKSTFTDDAVKIDPLHNEVLLDNDRVRVVRIHFAPGESGPIVDKRARVIVARTDSKATVTFPDGHSEQRDMKAGTVSFGDAGRQSTKNTGTTAIENIVVELKSKESEKK